MAQQVRGFQNAPVEKGPVGNGQPFYPAMYGWTSYPGTQRPTNVPPTNQWAVNPSQVAAAMGYSPAQINAQAASRLVSTTPSTPMNASQAAARDASRLVTTTPSSGAPYVPEAGGFTPASTSPGNQPPVDTSNIGDTTSGSDTAAFRFSPDGKAYSPEDVSTLLANPDLFQQEYLSSLGINNAQSQGAMGNFYQTLPYLAAFYNAQRGGAVSDGDRLAGIQNQLLSNYTTPGGRGPAMNEILQQLFGKVQQVGDNAGATNQLQALYGDLAPDDQIKAIGNLLNASIAGIPGPYGDAISNQLDRAAMRWKQAQLNANNPNQPGYINPMPFAQFLANDPLFQQFAGM